MKKNYIKPATECLRVMTEGVMKQGASVYNAGTGEGSEAPDNAGENNKSDIDVDAKGYGDWDNVWED